MIKKEHLILLTIPQYDAKWRRWEPAIYYGSDVSITWRHFLPLYQREPSRLSVLNRHIRHEIQYRQL